MWNEAENIPLYSETASKSNSHEK